MKNRNTIWIGLGIVVLVVAVILFSRYQNKEKKRVVTDWTPNYEYDERVDPFDVDITRNVLQDAVGEENFEVLPDTGSLAKLLPKTPGHAYMYIGSYYPAGTEDVDALVEFIENGNDVHLYCERFSDKLKTKVFGEPVSYCSDGSWELLSTMRADSFQLFSVGTFNDTVKLLHPPELMSRYRKLCYFNEDATYCRTNELWDSMEFLQYSEIGLMEEMPTYAKISINYGGHLYIHTVPMAFTNIHMLDEAMFEHLNGVLSYVDQRKVLWDEAERSKIDNDPFDSPANQYESTMRYLYSQKELRYAFFIALLGLMLYLFFSIKRRQRPIPMVDQNRNLSLQSLKMISRLYYLHPDHNKLARDKMSIFLHFIRKRYGLNTQELDDDFMANLVIVSGVPSNFVKKIFNSYNVVDSQTRTHPDRLIQLTQWINQFYDTCK